ncbi:Retrovirus-related Pol polyprotein from transposon 17.6 [Exaiptasia diaphana]|nr:Retrovirus-related Pol polyprotein from transposon 17.6 [Exaiptasia diaphana]
MASSTSDGYRLRWQQNEEISRWILRVELYAASQGWDDRKTAGKAALNLPNDKLDVLLALSGDDRTSWKKIKEILVREFQPSKENSEELFLNRVKKDGVHGPGPGWWSTAPGTGLCTLTFTTESGHWEFMVMPFGVKNAPVVFSRLMSDVMRGLSWNGIAIYLDDIIIGGASFEEHLQLLKDVFVRLRDAGLTVKSSKVHLCQRTLRFLGHIVSVDGISPDPEKVQTLRDWPRPQTTRDVRSFLGLCNYYMEFIPDMQIMAKPLNELTGKVKFEWSAEREKAFCGLKEALTSTPVLAFPDLTRPFELSTDASDTGFGCILSQRDNYGCLQNIY